VSSYGVPLTADQQLVLQAVYDRFHEDGTWPAFITVDRPLRRAHGLDTGAVYLSLPDSLVIKSRPGLGFAPNEELRLRLRGIQACDGSSEDTDRFVRLLPWLAQRELDFEPEPGMTETDPRATSEEVREFLGLDEGDHVALKRLHAMLQLDNWGLGGGGSNDDSWFVNLGPNIWRFRDVQTVKDCIEAREQWVAEAHAAVLPMVPAAPTHFFHVRIATKSKPSREEVRLDLSEDELESRFLAPYRNGRPMVINGTTVPLDDFKAIHITRSEQSSAELRPIEQAEQRTRRAVAMGLPEDWRVAKRGQDVTDQFITEPPGSAVIQEAVPASQPLALPAPALYVDRTIVDTIRAKVGVSTLDVTKLLGLVEELNDNHGRENTYASHALLRAILDHLPPILGLKTFNEVVSNYSWGHTDGKYMKKLLDFKLQADDALHRVISPKPDLLGQEDMPPRVWVNKLLQECADKL
jgi:hypothetical protein